MSNSNSKVMHNDVQRSIFDYRKDVKTTQGLGTVGVTNVELALAGDTLKARKAAFYELKPTTDRLASQIKSREMSAVVPMRHIMRYWSEFISKGDKMVQNGAGNVPYLENVEQRSVKFLPFCYPMEVVNHFLATFNSVRGSSAIYSPVSRLIKADPNMILDADADLQVAEMNKQEYTFSYLSKSGSVLNMSGAGTKANLPWWFPRLLESGPTYTQVNFNYNTSGGSYPDGCIHLFDNNSIQLARMLFSMMKANLSSVNFSLQLSDISCLKVYYRCNPLNGYVDFALAVGSDIYSLPALFPSDTMPTVFKVYTDYTVQRYGDVQFDKDFNNVVYSGTVTPKTVWITASDANVLASFCYDAAVTAIFNRPSLLGYGSLSESLGHHFFDEYTFGEILRERIGSSTNLGSYSTPAADATFTLVNHNAIVSYYGFNTATGLVPFTTYDEDAKMNVLPYFAYQKVLTDRFLLPHNVLSNNPGQDSTINPTAKFDSPYWRNNMVPTQFYGHPDTMSPNSIFRYAVLVPVLDRNTSNWSWSDQGGAVRTEAWHFCIPVNQMLTIFLDRGYLMDMDAFTEVWQKQDQNTNDLLQSAGFGNFSNGVVNAKSWLIAKKLGQHFWFGGTDLTADQVLKHHFGLQTVPCEDQEVTVLGANTYDLATQDVLNNGGAVDQNGDSRPLGDKVSICSNNIGIHNTYNAHIPEFAYILDLHWFTVKTERSSVPQPAVHAFEQALNYAGLPFALAFKLFFYPEFQAIGDDLLTLNDVESFAPAGSIGWTNKNNLLKEGYNEYRGEWKNKFKKMIVTPYPSYRRGYFLPSLTYGYLMPTPKQYDLHLVDKFGDAFLIDVVNDIYKKSTMTKRNEAGLNI